jgi:hypothetical protein
LTKVKELLIDIGRGILKAFAVIKDPAGGAREGDRWLDFRKNINKYVLIIQTGITYVRTGIIKGIDNSFLEGGAVIVDLLETGLEIKIVRSTILSYQIYETKDKLYEAVSMLNEAGFFKQGSLLLTYRGIIHASSESLLILSNENEKLFAEEGIGFVKIKEISREIQEEPFDVNLFHAYSKELTSLLLSLPNTKLDLSMIEAMTNYLTNIESALIICAANDIEMRKRLLRVHGKEVIPAQEIMEDGVKMFYPRIGNM